MGVEAICCCHRRARRAAGAQGVHPGRRVRRPVHSGAAGPAHMAARGATAGGAHLFFWLVHQWLSNCRHDGHIGSHVRFSGSRGHKTRSLIANFAWMAYQLAELCGAYASSRRRLCQATACLRCTMQSTLCSRAGHADRFQRPLRVQAAAVRPGGRRRAALGGALQPFRGLARVSCMSATMLGSHSA